MKRRTDWKRVLIQCVCFTLVLICVVLGLAEVLMPESGKKTKKNGGLTIDYTHMEDGYVMVKAAKGKKKLKVRVKCGSKTTLTYDLNNNGEYEVFPLQYGSGSYTWNVYRVCENGSPEASYETMKEGYLYYFGTQHYEAYEDK